MKRLLCIVGGMNRGGAETFLMKIYRQLDKSKFQMDFAVAERGVYDSEILSYGGKIYNITPKSKNILKNFNDIKNIVKENKYVYVLRTSQHSLSALELLAAKMGGAKKCIYRSSNSNSGSTNFINQLMHKAFIFMPQLFANVKIAPSTEAAKFMFGKRYVDKGKVNIIHNGLDLNLYEYSENARKRIRKEFSINDTTIVMGHIGRFNYQKNHKFLIDIFREYHISNSDSILLLVGVGELENEIKEKIQKEHLENFVIFAGLRNDIRDLLSAMDVFVFPSFYEGMPNTVIEAQACGLSCVIADTITREANITNLVTYCSLNDSLKNWNTSIEKNINVRENTKDIMMKEKYDINSVVKEFVNVVFGE